jgi:AAA domain
LPRLLALGGDQNRVFRWKPPDDTGEPFRIPSQLDRLEAEIERTHSRLVIIDPLVDFLDPGVSVNSDQGIRRALTPLRLLAERNHCLILMIRHLIKRSLSRALYRGSGSIGIAGACRSAWLIGRDPNNAERRVFAPQKGNYSAVQAHFANHHVVKADNAIGPGLARIAARLEAGALRVVKDRCPNLLKEADLYGWSTEPNVRQAEVPIDEHNREAGEWFRRDDLLLLCAGFSVSRCLCGSILTRRQIIWKFSGRPPILKWPIACNHGSLDMPAHVIEELRDFYRFLSEKLSDGRIDWSPEEALDEWRRLHPDAQAPDDEVAAIQEALDDMAHGDRGIPFEEFDRAFRKKHRLPGQP